MISMPTNGCAALMNHSISFICASLTASKAGIRVNLTFARNHVAMAPVVLATSASASFPISILISYSTYPP